MDYGQLRRTGLKVSPLCLGTMQWGWTADEERGFEIMDGANSIRQLKGSLSPLEVTLSDEQIERLN